jgi:hypothetical protein
LTPEGSKAGFPIEDQALFDQRTKYVLKVKKLTENDGAWFDHECHCEVVNGSSGNFIFMWIATYRGRSGMGSCVVGEKVGMATLGPALCLLTDS